MGVACNFVSLTSIAVGLVWLLSVAGHPFGILFLFWARCSLQTSRHIRPASRDSHATECALIGNTSDPSGTDCSLATLVAMLMAATLRGCVTPTIPFLVSPDSCKYCRN